VVGVGVGFSQNGNTPASADFDRSCDQLNMQESSALLINLRPPTGIEDLERPEDAVVSNFDINTLMRQMILWSFYLVT
jgi:hypothetical protein